MLGNTNANNKADLSNLSEKINITLKTNQETNDDLIGTVVTLSYGLYSENIRWEGKRLTFSVMNGINYTISFSEVEGYKTPDSLTFEAIANNVSLIEAEYQTEIVTVTVSADSGASVSEQILTINDVAIPLSDSNIITRKIPYGITYTIKVNNFNGYTLPFELSFTAGQPKRSVDMIYIKFTYGVFIEDINGSLYSEDTIFDNINFINGIRIKNENYDYLLAFEIPSAWFIEGGYDKPWEPDNLMPPKFETEQSALTDFNGFENTAKLYETYKDEGYMQSIATNYKWPNGEIGGYIPALGELYYIMQNFNKIQKIFNNHSQYIYDTTFLSSTYYGQYQDNIHDYYNILWYIDFNTYNNTFVIGNMYGGIMQMPGQTFIIKNV